MGLGQLGLRLWLRLRQSGQEDQRRCQLSNFATTSGAIDQLYHQYRQQYDEQNKWRESIGERGRAGGCACTVAKRGNDLDCDLDLCSGAASCASGSLFLFALYLSL